MQLAPAGQVSQRDLVPHQQGAHGQEVVHRLAGALKARARHQRGGGKVKPLIDLQGGLLGARRLCKGVLGARGVWGNRGGLVAGSGEVEVRLR